MGNGSSALLNFVNNSSLRNGGGNSLFDALQADKNKKVDAETLERLKASAKAENDFEGFKELLARKFSIPTQATKERVAKNNERRQILYDAVINRYGTKANIPASVLKAMDIDKFSLKTVKGRGEVVTSGRPLTDRRIEIVQSAILAADKEVEDVKTYTGLDRDQLMKTLGLKSTDEMPPRLKTLLLVLAGRPDDVRSGGGITPQMAKDIIALRAELLSLRGQAATLAGKGEDLGVISGKTLKFGNFQLCLALDKMGKISVSLSRAGKSATGSKVDFDMQGTNADKTLDLIETDIAGDVALYGKNVAMDVLKRAGGFENGRFTDCSLRAREVGTKVLSSATGAKTSEFASCDTRFIQLMAEKALRGLIGDSAAMIKFMQGLSAKNLTNDAETLKLYEHLNKSLEKDAKGVAEKVKMSPADALKVEEAAVLAKMDRYAKYDDYQAQLAKYEKDLAAFEGSDLPTVERKIADLQNKLKENETKKNLTKGEVATIQVSLIGLQGRKQFIAAGWLKPVEKPTMPVEFKLTEAELKEREKVEAAAAEIFRRQEAAELRGAIADVIFEEDTGGADVARQNKDQVPGARFGEAMKRNKEAFVKLIANPEKFDLLPEQIREPLRSALEKAISGVEGGGSLAGMKLMPTSLVATLFDKMMAECQEERDVEITDDLTKKSFTVRETGFAALEREFNAAVKKGADEIQKRISGLFDVALPGVNGKDDAKPPKAKDLVDEVVSQNKTLDDLVSDGVTDLKSGYGAFTKKVLSSYFSPQSMTDEDRRAMFATMLRFAPPPDPKNFDVKDLFTEREREEYALLEKTDKTKAKELLEAKAAAHKEELDGRLLGALFKGTGPLLLKMLQGMPKPKDNPILSIALADVKSNLAPIPRKVVQANLLDVVERSKGEIKSIEVTKSLGAASVGQAFLCRATLNKVDEKTGEPLVKDVVVKMLRPDVKNRLTREKACFLAAADSVSGMSETYRGQLERIMDELDLTVEARNVLDGVHNYGDGAFGNLDSMRLDPIVPSTANVMILEKAPGTTLDRYATDMRAEIERARAPCIGPVDKATGEASFRYPGLDAYMNMREKLVKSYADLLQKRDMLESLSLKWVSEGLYGSGFYHGDLHSGNMMVDGETNKLTVIDFGNVTKLTKDQQSAIMKMMAAAAGGKDCVNLFVEGFRSLLSPAGKSALDRDLGEVKRLLAHLFADEVGNKTTTKDDVGQRIAAALTQLQRLGLELPGPVHNFSQCQMRLQNAVDEINGLMRTIREAMVKPILAIADSDSVQDNMVDKMIDVGVADMKKGSGKDADGLQDEFVGVEPPKAGKNSAKAPREGEGWLAYMIRTTPVVDSPELVKLKGYFQSDAENRNTVENLVRGLVNLKDGELFDRDCIETDEKSRLQQLVYEVIPTYAVAHREIEDKNPLPPGATREQRDQRDQFCVEMAFKDNRVAPKVDALLKGYTELRKIVGARYFCRNCYQIANEHPKSSEVEEGNLVQIEKLTEYMSAWLDWIKEPENKGIPNLSETFADTLKGLEDHLKIFDKFRVDVEPKRNETYEKFMEGSKIMSGELRTFSDHVGAVIRSNIGSCVWQLGLVNSLVYGDKLE